MPPLADAEGAKKHTMIELLKSYGGLSYVSFELFDYAFLCLEYLFMDWNLLLLSVVDGAGAKWESFRAEAGGTSSA